MKRLAENWKGWSLPSPIWYSHFSPIDPLFLRSGAGEYKFQIKSKSTELSSSGQRRCQLLLQQLSCPTAPPMDSSSSSWGLAARWCHPRGSWWLPVRITRQQNEINIILWLFNLFLSLGLPFSHSNSRSLYKSIFNKRNKCITKGAGQCCRQLRITESGNYKNSQEILRIPLK